MLGVEPIPSVNRVDGLRYADIVPLMHRELEVRGREVDASRARIARSLYYNVYTVPWRSTEILDIFEKQTGRGDLSGLAVLDLGAGFASMDLFMLLDGGARTVVGLDIQPSMLDYARSIVSEAAVENLHLVCADVGRSPFAKERFDLVISYDSLYSVGIPKETTIARIFDSLRPGGTVIIKVMNRSCPPFRILALPGVRAIARRSLSKIERGAGRTFGFVQPNAPTAGGLLRMLRHAGFTDERLYNRYTRQPSGWLRWLLPHIFVAARRP